MNIHKLKAKFLLGLIVLAVFVVGIGLFVRAFSNETNSKKEWGELQSLEEQHRQQEEKLSIQSKYGDNFLVVPTSTDPSKVWILLNSKSDPFYKQMPDGPYALSQNQFEMVKGSGLASPYVLSVLAGHVK